MFRRKIEVTVNFSKEKQAEKHTYPYSLRVYDIGGIANAILHQGNTAAYSFSSQIN
jgi:hypothetical protein